LEPNISGVVTMVTFQKQDSDHMYAWQLTQESEVHQVIADDDDEKVFIDNKEAIRFGGVNKMKTEDGQIEFGIYKSYYSPHDFSPSQN
jgi:hypothetical protein